MPKRLARFLLWVLCVHFGSTHVFGQSEAGVVAMQNVELLLEGVVTVEAGEVVLSETPRAIRKKLERVVADVWSIAGASLPDDFRGFSDEVENLLTDIDELDNRDTRRLGARLVDLSEEDRLYWLVQSRLEEVKLQIAVEMGVYANRRLRSAIAADEVGLSDAEVAEMIANWSQIDPEAPLPSLPFDGTGAPETEDRSALPGRSRAASSTSSSDSPLLDRIVALLEAHDERITALESGSTRGIDGRRNASPDFQGAAGLRPPSTVPALAAIGLPDGFDIRFGPGTAALGLNAQMQLSEVIELMGRYPELRVVCTGHTDAEGDRASNIALSRRRAQAVRAYLLQSGVRDERVLMNYFGEDRSENAGAADRRVEVAFFAN